MWHTLSYSSTPPSIQVSGKYWSDFGGHLPQIRSFSFGSNWPPEYPLYPNQPIRYHFLFYFLVGLLEKAGLRLDWALNLPSALGFFALLLMIFALAKRLFASTSVAFLSVLFFLFNGSFSWLDYLKTYNYDFSSALSHLPSLSSFPAFAPWNSSTISAFWNLNIYTNQRHLGLSFALALVVVYLLLTSPRRSTFLVGFLLGILLLLNQAAMAAAILFVGWFFLFRPQTRWLLLLSAIGFLPWLAISLIFTHTSAHLTFHPGFLFRPPFTLSSFTWYWLQNLGLHLFLIPLGFLLAPRAARFLIIPLLFLFILPNLFQFSPDIINNHKFFNFFLIFGVTYSASIVIRLSRLKLIGPFFFLLLTPSLTLGGLVDFFPIKNDTFYELLDYPASPAVAFFTNHTSPTAIVLNSTWFYHPASLAGRKIFNGYPYFTWSFGYDQAARENQTLSIYRAPDKSTACSLLNQSQIDFVELNSHPETFLHPHLSLWEAEFIPVYQDSQISVYSVSQNCPLSLSPT